MQTTTQNHSSVLKAKVALETAKEEMITATLSQKVDLHASQIKSVEKRVIGMCHRII